MILKTFPTVINNRRLFAESIVSDKLIFFSPS